MSTKSVNLNRRSYWEHPYFSWGIFGMLAMLFLLNRSPYPGFDDGMGFLLEAESGFNFHTNATNHFLYINLSHLLVKLFFFIPAVWVLTLLPIFFSLAALWRVYQIGKLFVAPNLVALMPVIILGLSFTFWQQTEIIEVYAFNNYLFLSFIYFAFKDILRGKRQHFLFVSLFLGIGLLTHIQNILSLPFFLFYIFSKNELKLGQKVLSTLIVAALFFILFIPALFFDLNSISEIFFDRKFRGNVLGFDIMTLLTGMQKGMIYMAYNFHLFLLFIMFGWFRMWKVRRSMFYIFLLITLPYLGFAIKYNVNDNHVFFLIANIILVIPSLFTFEFLAMKLLPYMTWMLPMMFMMSPMIYGAATIMTPGKVDLVTRYDQEKAYKGGAVHLLWPGKAWAKDPLKLAEKIYLKDPTAYSRGEIEWNYPAAIEYLKLKGRIK
ncbi:MAG TPA: hypothetical protein ENJ82_17165 [Bacteroidetes bacterium]|nr:hypothetical protein [Bacteroidota bacterium]